MSETLFIIGDIIMSLALLGSVVFTVSYASFFNWRITAAGRSLMYFILALDFWALQALLSRINPEYWGREWVRIIIYFTIMVTVWRLVFALWQSWKHTPINIQPRKSRKE